MRISDWSSDVCSSDLLKPLSVRLLRYNVWLLAAAVGQRPVSASICHAERRILAAAPWGRSAPPRLHVASAQQSLPQLTCLVRVGQQIGPRPHVRSQYGDRGRQVADQLPDQRDSDASPLVLPQDLEGRVPPGDAGPDGPPDIGKAPASEKGD